MNRNVLGLFAVLLALGAVRAEEKTEPPGQAKKEEHDQGKGQEKKDDGKVANPALTPDEKDAIVTWAGAAKSNRVTNDLRKDSEKVIDRMRGKFYSHVELWTWNDFMARMRVMDELKKLDKFYGPAFVLLSDEKSPLVDWCACAPDQGQLVARVSEISKAGILGDNGYQYIFNRYMEGKGFAHDTVRSKAFLKGLKGCTPEACHKAIADLLGEELKVKRK